MSDITKRTDIFYDKEKAVIQTENTGDMKSGRESDKERERQMEREGGLFCCFSCLLGHLFIRAILYVCCLVVVRCYLYEPLSLYRCDNTHVLLRGESQLMITEPSRRVLILRHDGGRVYVHSVLLLNSLIVTAFREL